MSSFGEMCDDAVKRFIRSVAIIDDEATYNYNQPSHENKEETKIVQLPVTSLMTVNHDAVSSETKEVITEAGIQNEHGLDAKRLINAFADMSIACCIQCPKHEESPLKRAIKLAVSVDVLVIDWLLDTKEMSLPRDIIKNVLKEDKRTGGRMRLIVVYTAQPYVDQMLKDLKKDADDVYKTGLVIDKKHLLITSDCLRIVILNKEATIAPPEVARIVSFDQLPINIISEFSHLVKGIIPGSTLHGIAAMRENIHNLLSTLNSNLDGAYCLHRALLHEPMDSVDFAMNLITSEIETVIQTDAQARQFVDKFGLKAWLKDYAGEKTTLPCRDSSLSVKTIEKYVIDGQLSKKDGINAFKKEFSSHWIQMEIDKGHPLKDDNDNSISMEKGTELIKQNKWEHIKGCRPPNVSHFVDTLYPTSKDATNGCKELSRLQCTTRDTVSRLYIDDHQSPTIQLGSILKARKQVHGRMIDDWFLCLTPLCDCIRLDKEEKVEFLFLHLYPGKKDSADIFIEMQKGKYQPLVFKANNKKIEILTIPFHPNTNDRIRAYRWRREWRVKSHSTSFQWVAELRHNKALAIAHRVAANTSRVGIDEFEWLRQQATFKN